MSTAHVSDETKSLRDLFTEFYRLRLRNRAETTIKRYGYSLDKFEKFLHRTPTVADLTNDTVLDLMDHLLKKEKLSARSVNNVRCYLCSLWRFGNRQGSVRLGPDVGSIPEPEDTPRAFTLEEIHNLICSAYVETTPIGGVHPGLWWETIIRATFDTGERSGAVLQWRWEMLDMESGFLAVPGSIRKGKKRAKIYRLKATTLKLLEQFPVKRGVIFNYPNHLATLYHSFRRIAKRAGLPTGRKFKFHCIRKSHASYLEAAGGDATESLGHSQRSLTIKTYIDCRISGGKIHSDILPDLEGPSR